MARLRSEVGTGRRNPIADSQAIFEIFNCPGSTPGRKIATPGFYTMWLQRGLASRNDTPTSALFAPRITTSTIKPNEINGRRITVN